MKSIPTPKKPIPPSMPQPLLTLDSPTTIPAAARQQYVTLLAQILQTLIQHDRKERTNER